MPTWTKTWYQHWSRCCQLDDSKYTTISALTSNNSPIYGLSSIPNNNKKAPIKHTAEQNSMDSEHAYMFVGRSPNYKRIFRDLIAAPTTSSQQPTDRFQKGYSEETYNM